MHISGRTAVGLLGLASISFALPISNSTASGPSSGVNITVAATAVTNTTGNTTNATAISAPARPVTINATHELNMTITGVATNSTEDANNTSYTATDIAKVLPFIKGGPGPVVFPNHTWDGSAEKRTIARIPTHSTQDSKNTSSTASDKAKVIPFITGGPGPVIFPNDKWNASAENYHFWLDDPPKITGHPTPEERRSLAAVENNKRDDPLPPRDRLLADHMEHYGQNLPECYKKCMRSEDGKSSIHMGQDNLGQICGIKWPLFAWWSEHHIFWCVNGDGGCDGHEPHREAYRWLKWTCGDKPARV